MNVFNGFLLVFLGLALSSVDAQIATRQETSEDKACGPHAYYNYARHTCLPF
uniref:Met75Ca n=2 Tax=Drosophila melanogaster TaxID=7227 RepID=Q9V449_DROME|eukprot:NP_651980.1 Met75Cb [Drosophila melanogaster]